MQRCLVVYSKYHLNFLKLLCYKLTSCFVGDNMEIFGGFMVMMSIISLFLAVVWLIMPFVVFAIKGKQDRTLEVLEVIEKRLAAIEARLQQVEPEPNQAGQAGYCESSAESSEEPPFENVATHAESAAEKKSLEESPAA